MRLDDDDFTLLGLPQRFALDRTALDERWRSLQQRVHPDRFASEGAAAQRVAMQWAVRVNEAVRRLRDPLQRATVLCGLRGVAIDAERNTAMPAAFLQHQMAWREALDDAGDLAAVRAIADEVRGYEADALQRLARQLDDEGDAAAAAETVRALMFVARFKNDIERRLDALETST